MTKGQQDFVDQMTRKLITDWCFQAICNKTEGVRIPESQKVFREHAVDKKWLSRKDGTTGENRILASGWATAARFLKR